ncbi:MAG: VPDSG-CTERM sorting domain-containing protein [Verrucomicrobia bacterium]|nr:VPDSG-CTERM sorting domain-containing protein [Verrucomicrobiota bacterium]
MKSLLLTFASLTLAASLQALPIGLFNTGVNSSGVGLALGANDSHYDVVQNGLADAVVVSSPPGVWLANTSASEWIWQAASGQPTNVDRTFRTTFDMTGLSLSSAVINGRWSTDNLGMDILVNGVSTGQTATGFTSWFNFSIGSGLLVSGVNTIDFVVRDQGSISGFRAEFTTATASAAGVPDGGTTVVLLGAGLLGLVAVRRKLAA